MDSFGEMIKIAREEKGLFLRQVAAHIDIDQAIISKFERGDRTPTREQVEKFIKLYKLNRKQTFTLWLCDKITSLLIDEENAEEALHEVVKRIKK
jgi:transcriptional regulator with XRE-family HTH domain